MHLFRPDRHFTRVTAIDPARDLRDAGISCVLLDMDNTLVARDTHAAPDDVRVWLEGLGAYGVRACILSNNCHASAYDHARDLGLPIVAKACKPLPFSYGRALRLMGTRKEATVGIGDQLATDVLGAHLHGMRAFYVDPLCTADLAYMHVLRAVDRRILAGMDAES